MEINILNILKYNFKYKYILSHFIYINLDDHYY